MSNTDSSQKSSISHNVYFDGNVQSLGLQTTDGKATLGVMKKGTYRFSASTPERMVIITGMAKVKLHDQEWTAFANKGEFNVAANTAFDIVCDTDVAYLCYYG